VTAQLVANQLREPRGGTNGAPITSYDTMNRDRRGPWLEADLQQVAHLERGSLDPGEGDVDVDLIPKSKGPEIPNRDLDNGEVDALGPDILIRMPEGTETFDAGFLQIREVGGMVDHRHGVGLGEAHPQSVMELVLIRFGGRVKPHAHGRLLGQAATLTGRRRRP
jgi:hypothetical protein